MALHVGLARVHFEQAHWNRSALSNKWLLWKCHCVNSVTVCKSCGAETATFSGLSSVSPGAPRLRRHCTSLYPLCCVCQVTSKEVRCDLVTEVDRECEQLITKTVARTFPLHKVIGEETATEEAMGLLEEGALGPYDWAWIIDPIDGTLNFVSASFVQYAYSDGRVRRA